jgi:Protein of unknown function (DUF1350)
VNRKQRTDPTHSSNASESPEVFQQVEGLIVSNLGKEDNGSWGRGDWRQVRDCWVLRPPAIAGPPQAVAIFVGGAFVGAAPQVVYKLFLEALAARGVMVRTFASPAFCNSRSTS